MVIKHAKRIGFLLLIILALMIISVEVEPFSTYSSERYFIQYPSDWEASEGSINFVPTMRFIEPEIDNDNYRESLQVFFIKESSKNTPPQIPSEYELKLKLDELMGSGYANITYVEKISNNEFEILTESKTGKAMYTLFRFVYVNEGYYIVSFTGEGSKIAEYEGIAYRMLDSFTVK